MNNLIILDMLSVVFLTVMTVVIIDGIISFSLGSHEDI